MAHLGFAHEGQPFVIPTLHARIGEDVYVHGSSASRTLRALGGALPACLTVTLLDGVVLARSVFEMSANYRSVVILGEATAVTAPDEKLAALEAFSEQVLPGRWAEARGPTRQELKATAVLKLPLTEASAKISAGGPDDGESEDAAAARLGRARAAAARRRRAGAVRAPAPRDPGPARDRRPLALGQVGDQHRDVPDHDPRGRGQPLGEGVAHDPRVLEPVRAARAHDGGAAREHVADPLRVRAVVQRRRRAVSSSTLASTGVRYSVPLRRPRWTMSAHGGSRGAHSRWTGLTNRRLKAGSQSGISASRIAGDDRAGRTR